ncbi:glycosyl hydrolase family 65 protein [Nocardia mexicana]|uniref:Trehalose/maltose hydrolase-like predicted phosphorylase n=1 Tax=Nocardia mexicana TaxID=279262 RepID=A0A370HDB1_9NOCA|nr:glycosyl hydrolase family 65 protein [Nocardia mexicana]RDI55221.1 trehalose/maltose hydrolase-like predicted phosphorylase [Nocardia mexicana]
MPADVRNPAADADAHVTLRAQRGESLADGVRGDPRWTIREGAGRHPVADASVFAVGSGGFATRGVPEESGAQGIFAAGVYTGAGAEQHLLEGPAWTPVELDPPPAVAELRLDLREGVLHREEAAGGTFRSLRFACADKPGVFAMRVDTDAAQLRPGPPLRAPAPEPGVRSADVLPHGSDDETSCLRIESETGALVAAAAQRVTDARLDRIVACGADTPDRTGSGRVLHGLRHAWQAGVDGLLAAHRETWARRWQDVGIELPDDPETELAVRFALFQLWCNTGSVHGESAVGARGISGPGYRGHVFWDSDVFVLPALVSIDPDAAAAMVAYRVNRLDAARKRARSDGRRGARFPWESAADGTDVTPRRGFLGGVPVPIRTGAEEEHITADIAWAANHYAEWTGTTPIRELLTETARYWASRARTDGDGRVHIDGVIGPDEYHECVDDNAYTNVMARWNLRRAARLAPGSPWDAAEFEQWTELAEGIVDQLHSDGRYEQFTGYFDLEPLTAAAVAGRPVAADVLLGQARVTGSQLIKQPDVLMLHHLVPAEVAPGSLVPNLEFYGPRTTHGSSLSPAIMAALLARAGRADDALEMLRPALRLDLDDRTATTAAGLHMATLGGVWQALLAGFAGVRVSGGVLSIRPVLPERWRRFGIRFRCLGRRICLDISADGLMLRTDGPIAAAVGARIPVRVSGEMWWPAREKGSG